MVLPKKCVPLIGLYYSNKNVQHLYVYNEYIIIQAFIKGRVPKRNIFFISQPNICCGYSKHMLKLMYQNMFIILRSKKFLSKPGL